MAVDGQQKGRILRNHGERGSDIPGAGTMGITLFLASLSMLFIGSLVAVVEESSIGDRQVGELRVTRADAEHLRFGAPGRSEDLPCLDLDSR